MTPEEFMQAEKSQMNRLDRWLRNYPELHNTESIADKPWVASWGDKKTIRRSVPGKITAIAFSLVGLFFVLVLLLVMLGGSLPAIIPGSMAAFAVVLTCMPIWFAFFNSKVAKIIRLSHSELMIDKTTIPWSELATTCIMIKGAGKNRREILVLFKTDGTVAKFDFSQSAVYYTTLAAMIEYYKPIKQREVSGALH